MASKQRKPACCPWPTNKELLRSGFQWASVEPRNQMLLSRHVLRVVGSNLEVAEIGQIRGKTRAFVYRAAPFEEMDRAFTGTAETYRAARKEGEYYAIHALRGKGPMQDSLHMKSVVQIEVFLQVAYLANPKFTSPASQAAVAYLIKSGVICGTPRHTGPWALTKKGELYLLRLKALPFDG